MEYEKGKVLYQNPLASPADVRNFVLEGTAEISFLNGAMRLTNVIDASQGQKANYVFWCPVEFPDNIEIRWQFSPAAEPGLAILFFAARGTQGTDLFSDSLRRRTGEYGQYHSGDINCLHVSYFRRMWATERCFHTCNLRKSYGFHLVAQGADPLPDVLDSKGFYDVRLVKKQERVAFWMENLLLFTWRDSGEETGDILGGGRIGFRQMAPLAAEYKNLVVTEVL
ncbi:MAG: DUF1961 family protein [Bacillota bacterium]